MSYTFHFFPSAMRSKKVPTTVQRVKIMTANGCHFNAGFPKVAAAMVQTQKKNLHVS